MLDSIQRGWRRPRLLNRLLLPLAWLYAAAVTLRRHAYRAGVVKPHRLPAKVIVIGNLTVGGAGKTPLTIEVAAEAARRGWRPGIVTRGYRGKSKSRPLLVTDATTADAAGDEALLLHRRCRAPVAADPDRVRAARALIADHACDLIVADDGFQHLRLARDLDIVVIAARGFGNGWCLPAGPLREPVGAVRDAGVVVLHGDKFKNQPPAFTMTTAVAVAVPLTGGAHRRLADFTSAHAVAGVADPDKFFAQLADAGVTVTPHPFPDHHRFAAADFAFADDDAAVVMTEKDAVKCEAILPPALAGRCWVVPLTVTLGDGLLDEIFARLN